MARITSLTVAMTGPRGGETKETGTLKEKIIEWTVKVATSRATGQSLAAQEARASVIVGN